MELDNEYPGSFFDHFWYGCDLPLLYLQGKGRARAKPSLHVMMCDSGEMAKYCDEIAGYKSIEDNAIDLCHEEFDAELTDEDADEIEVYTILSVGLCY